MRAVLWTTQSFSKGKMYLLVYPTPPDKEAEGDLCYLPWEMLTFSLKEEPFAIELKGKGS